MALLFTIKVALERSWWGRGAQVSHSGELLLRDYSDVETKGAPHPHPGRPAVVVSDQQALSGVTSHSLPSLPHLAPCLPWLRIPKRRWRGFS